MSPTAKVTHDDKIRGNSGRLRKCDVTISLKVGTTTILVVIDCKRHKRPVKMKYIEAFSGQLKDVNANAGIVIANTGFDAGAKGVAPQLNIVLQSYRDANEEDWSKVLGQGWVVWPTVNVEFLKVFVRPVGQEGFIEIPLLTHLHTQGNEAVPIAERFKYAPQSTIGLATLGEANVGIELDYPAFIEGLRKSSVFEDGAEQNVEELIKVEIDAVIFTVDVKAKKYVFNLNISKGNVIEDVLKESVEYWELETTDYDWDLIEKTAQISILEQEEYTELTSKRGQPEERSEANDKKFRWSLTSAPVGMD